MLALTAMGLSIVFGVMRVVNVAQRSSARCDRLDGGLSLGAHPAIDYGAIIIAPLLVGVLMVHRRDHLQKIDYHS